MIARASIITFVVAIAAFLSPRWVAYAALGLILGLVIRLAVRLFRRSPRFRWGVASVIALCGMAVMFSLFFTSVRMMAPPKRTIAVEVNYTASISLLPDAPLWQVREEVLISETELRTDWLNRYPSPDEASNNQTSAGFSEEIRQHLQLEEWDLSGFVGSSEQFRRTRDFEATANWFRATTTFAIPIEIGQLRLYDSLIRLVPDSKSTITITSPKYVVASTFPAYSSRVDVLRDGQEKLTIPLKFSRFEQPEFRLAMLSPLLRWPLGPKIGSFSLWSVVQWFLLAVCAIFSEQIKEKLLKPIIAPLFPSKKQNDKDEAQRKNA